MSVEPTAEPLWVFVVKGLRFGRNVVPKTPLGLDHIPASANRPTLARKIRFPRPVSPEKKKDQSDIVGMRDSRLRIL